VLASGLLVVHDTSRCCENHVSELTRWQKLDNPLLKVTEADVVSWGDDTSLVESGKPLAYENKEDIEDYIPSVQLDDNLARSVVINFLELANIT
jgi:hypothetical protein